MARGPHIHVIADGVTLLSFVECFCIVVCCSVLLQRGADFNVEDSEGARADELARQCSSSDCYDAIVRRRQQHVSQLCKLVKQVLYQPVNQPVNQSVCWC